MKGFIKGFVLFIFAVLVFLVVTLPVQFALKFMPPNVPVKLVAAEGTVWKGSAQQLIVQGNPVGKIDWKIHPLSLLTASLNTDFTVDGIGILAKGNATVYRDQSIELSDTQISADAAKLPLPPSAQIVTPEGRINATVRSLSLINQRVDAVDSDIIWSPASITSPAEYELGEVSLNVTGKDGRLNGVLKSKDGPITANGKLNLEKNGQLKVDIKLAPNDTTPEDIREMLPMIGKPDRNGIVTIKRQINVPGWAK